MLRFQDTKTKDLEDKGLHKVTSYASNSTPIRNS